MNKLERKVAIVTGAGSGIGRATAISLANEGALIALTDIKKDANKDGFEQDIETPTLEIIKNEGHEAIFFNCNVSNLDEVKNLISETKKYFGSVDILCNIAGVGKGPTSILEKLEVDLEHVMDVNFKGVWNCCQQAIKQMLKQKNGGKIVNVSSVAAIRGIPKQPDYCVSKGAVSALTRQLAIDYGPYGININAVLPGWTRTSMQRFKKQEEREKAYNAVTPLRRIATVNDIANAITFLVSSDADYIQGHELVVDGGNTLLWDSMAHLEQ